MRLYAPLTWPTCNISFGSAPSPSWPLGTAARRRCSGQGSPSEGLPSEGLPRARPPARGESRDDDDNQIDLWRIGVSADGYDADARAGRSGALLAVVLALFYQEQR